MLEKAPNQASSTEDLVQPSAFEESMAAFGIGDLDSEHGVILKDWSAQDFSNIYVRFRPHLIGHARKFLREETHAEEVVQDAFLYLMTALPELDSELGVLRFLKWKTKMLCLDMIRSSKAGLNNNLVPLPDDLADETQSIDSLERADDAAIIGLALAKLSARQREALVATIYEDKSNQEVARQMGLSENAIRQLLFRARASFRQALVGQAEVEGKTVGEILTVAARRANKSRVGTLGVLGVALASLPLLFGGNVTFSPTETSPPSTLVSKSLSEITHDALSLELPNRDPSVLDGGGDLSKPEETTSTQEAAALPLNEDEKPDTNRTGSNSQPRDFVAASDSVLEPRVAAFASELGPDFANQMAQKSGSSSFGLGMNEGTVEINAGTELVAYVGYDLSTESVVNHFSIIYQSPIGLLTAVPTNSMSDVTENADGELEVRYVATDLIFGDLDGSFGNSTVEDAPMRKTGLRVLLVFSPTAKLVSANFEIIARST